MRVVCCSVPGAGHAHPMLSVARALAQRGHDVLVCSSWHHEDDATEAGAAFTSLPREERWSPVHALRPYEDAAQMARYLAPRFAEFRPDVVVADLVTLGAGLAAEMIGVSWVTLVTHGLHMPSDELPPFGWGRPPAGRAFRWRDELMRRGARRDLARARDDLNAAREELGLTRVRELDRMISPSLLLVATLPSLEIPRRDWPARAHVIGPCLWTGSSHQAAPEPPPGDTPLVLVAASTAHQQDDLVRASMSAVARLGWRAIVTTGKTSTPERVPPGVVVTGFVDHDAVIPRCDVVLCNGGHGIVARSLSRGVPVLVVPGHGDQRENGYRVERAGAGARVMRPRARDIARTLRRLYARPQFRQRAAEIAAEAASLDGPGRAAELVEELMMSGAARS